MKRLMMVSLAVAALVTISHDVYAQGGASAVPFLLISPNSRASGMGEGGTGIAEDAAAVFWNAG
jgi:hypothetical protein